MTVSKMPSLLKLNMVSVIPYLIFFYFIFIAKDLTPIGVTIAYKD
jgi:hypothetical protein